MSYKWVDQNILHIINFLLTVFPQFKPLLAETGWRDISLDEYIEYIVKW